MDKIAYLGYCVIIACNTIMNMGMHISFPSRIFILFRYSEVKMLDLMVAPFLIY